MLEVDGPSRFIQEGDDLRASPSLEVVAGNQVIDHTTAYRERAVYLLGVSPGRSVKSAMPSAAGHRTSHFKICPGATHHDDDERHHGNRNDPYPFRNCHEQDGCGQLTPQFSCKGFHKSARAARTINSSFVSCNACWAAAAMGLASFGSVLPRWAWAR